LNSRTQETEADKNPGLLQTDLEVRREMFQTRRNELLTQQFSNSEAYDKAVLTLSSAFLGVSVAFIKDVPHQGALTHLPLIFCSWSLLTLAIMGTVASFRVGNVATTIQIERDRRYYLEYEEKTYGRSPLARTVDVLNWTSGGLFLFGVILTVFFVSVNLSESNAMSKNSDKSGPVHAFDAHTISNTQKVETLTKAHTISDTLKVPQTPLPVAQPAPTAAAETVAPIPTRVNPK
jgi:hypothetical protein